MKQEHARSMMKKITVAFLAASLTLAMAFTASASEEMVTNDYGGYDEPVYEEPAPDYSYVPPAQDYSYVEETVPETTPAAPILNLAEESVDAVTPQPSGSIYVLNPSEDGNAFVVLESGGHFGLLDTGSEESAARLADTLLQAGGTTLDFVIVSSYDTGLGGLSVLADQLTINAVYVKSDQIPEGSDAQALISALGEKGTTVWQDVEEGFTTSLNQLTVTLVNCAPGSSYAAFVTDSLNGKAFLGSSLDNQDGEETRIIQNYASMDRVDFMTAPSNGAADANPYVFTQWLDPGCIVVTGPLEGTESTFSETRAAISGTLYSVAPQADYIRYTMGDLPTIRHDGTVSFLLSDEQAQALVSTEEASAEPEGGETQEEEAAADTDDSVSALFTDEELSSIAAEGLALLEEGLEAPEQEESAEETAAEPEAAPAEETVPETEPETVQEEGSSEGTDPQTEPAKEPAAVQPETVTTVPETPTIDESPTAASGKPLYSVMFETFGRGLNPPQTQRIEEGKTASDPGEITSEGLTFGGWYADKEGNYAYNFSSPVYADTVVYARWFFNTYEIAFDANGGEGSMDNMSCTYGAEVDLNAVNFTKDGYHFHGWNTSKDGTGTSYKDKETVSNLTTEQGDVIKLYAQWDINYAVTGGSGQYVDPSKGQQAAFLLNGDMKKLKTITMDGTQVECNISDQTVAIPNMLLLDLLPGTHNVSFEFEDGQCSSTFVVTDPADHQGGGITLYLIIIATAALIAGLLLVIYQAKKKQKKQ